MPPRQATMTVEELQWVRSLHWENEHTKLIASALGDPRACVAFDASATLTGDADSPRVGCWLFARVCKVKLTGSTSILSAGDQVQAPVIWWPWRDEVTKHPLPIYDPRVMTQWNAGDTHKHVGNQREIQRQAVRDAKEKKHVQTVETLALRAKDGFKDFKRWADTQFGFVGREGAGGQRKWFFRDSLQKG